MPESKVVLSIPHLAVKPAGFERNKELYVLSFTSDGNNTGSSKLPELIAAYNETLPNVLPGIQKQALMQYVLMAVSNTFHHITPDQPVSLSGSGILLYPNLDPNGMLDTHFVVVEDDQGKRDLGRMLNALFNDDGVKGLLDQLTAKVTPPLIAQLLNLLASNLPSIFAKNKDDFLFAHSHSGFSFDNYGLPAGETVTDFDLENRFVRCTLRVRLN